MHKFLSASIQGERPYYRGRKAARHDYNLLKREASRIRAEVDWCRSSTSLEIQVKAPNGFVWASNREQYLTATLDQANAENTREAVEDLIDQMQHGYEPNKFQTTHESTCECEECEAQDPELTELYLDAS